MKCVYCERPLICPTCDREFEPATHEEYEALNRREVPVFCPSPCDRILICRWCSTPYDGDFGDAGQSDGPD